MDLTSDFVSLTIRRLRPGDSTVQYMCTLDKTGYDTGDAGLYTVSLEGGAGAGVSEVSTLLVILSPPVVTIRMSPTSPVIEASKVWVMVIIINTNYPSSRRAFIVYFPTEGAHSAKNVFHN